MWIFISTIRELKDVCLQYLTTDSERMYRASKIFSVSLPAYQFDCVLCSCPSASLYPLVCLFASICQPVSSSATLKTAFCLYVDLSACVSAFLPVYHLQCVWNGVFQQHSHFFSQTFSISCVLSLFCYSFSTLSTTFSIWNSYSELFLSTTLPTS